MAEAVEGNKISLPQPEELFVRSWSPGKLFRCMAFFGPAAIVASASVGAGETVLAVRTGAWSGYALLWLLLVAALTKNGFLQYALGRYTAITGEYVGDAWAKLPGPRGWFLWFIVVIGLVMCTAFRIRDLRGVWRPSQHHCRLRRPQAVGHFVSRRSHRPRDRSELRQA